MMDCSKVSALESLCMHRPHSAYEYVPRWAGSISVPSLNRLAGLLEAKPIFLRLIPSHSCFGIFRGS